MGPPRPPLRVAPGGRSGALRAVLEQLSGKNLIASIAFNAPWTIGWQLRFVTRHLDNAAFLVADNSTDPQAAQQSPRCAREARVAYLELPENPYQGRRYASRSHGLALNWVYRNVMRELRPAAWGFFDHDLFPTRAFDPEKRLRGQPFYGELERRPGGAYLWPGYCLFSREADRDALLDFRQDWFVGLDTGGMNAELVAGHPQFASMTFAKSRSIGPGRNVAVTIDEIDWFDDCVHLGNASGWYRSNSEREPELDPLLQQIYDGTLSAPALD